MNEVINDFDGQLHLCMEDLGFLLNPLQTSSLDEEQKDRSSGKEDKERDEDGETDEVREERERKREKEREKEEQRIEKTKEFLQESCFQAVSSLLSNLSNKMTHLAQVCILSEFILSLCFDGFFNIFICQ